jgi:hypothetical protein
MKNIDWVKWSAIAEILSAIAIVFTLLYLSLQTQQTNRALFSSSRAEMMSADIQLLVEWANSPVSEGYLDTIRSWAPSELRLDDDGLMSLGRAENLFAAMVRIREFAWLQYRDGLLDDSAWDGYAATLVRNVESGFGPILWERFRAELDPGFVADIERRLSEN